MQRVQPTVLGVLLNSDSNHSNYQKQGTLHAQLSLVFIIAKIEATGNEDFWLTVSLNDEMFPEIRYSCHD